MSSTTETLSPAKKYAQKMLALIERDPQIAALQPKEEIGQAIIDATSLQQAIDIALLGYADRPALGERSYDMARDPGTGKLARRYLPNFSTITYAELRAKIVGLANAWRHHPSIRPTHLRHVVPGLGTASVLASVYEQLGQFCESQRQELQGRLYALNNATSMCLREEELTARATRAAFTYQRARFEPLVEHLWEVLRRRRGDSGLPRADAQGGDPARGTPSDATPLAPDHEK